MSCGVASVLNSSRLLFCFKDLNADISARCVFRPPPPPKPKTEKQVQSEIRDVMKQITSSVSFLPMLDEPCEI